MSGDLFDLPDSDPEDVRGALQQTGNWHRRACALVAATLPRGWTGTGEDIRLALSRVGLEQPHSPNAWGSMIRHCVEERGLKRTDQFRHMKAVRRHGRLTPVYRRT